MRKVYLPDTVDVAARKRIAWIFDEFERVIVSISGGKDSTVLCWLALQEAHKRGRKIGLFYLDYEAVYEATAEEVRYLMSLYPENTEKLWFQFPFCLQNAVSYQKGGQFLCWNPDSEADWMRPKELDSIQAPPWSIKKTHFRGRIAEYGYNDADVLTDAHIFYADTAFLLGIRADESLDRFRAVTHNAGYKSVLWSTKSGNSFNFYPLYDWRYEDIWCFIAREGIKYNKIYDYMYQKGLNVTDFRVDSFLHGKGFKSLTELPEFEPETFDRLLNRVSGVQVGYLYGKDKKMLKAQSLPKGFQSWKSYRDFLLETYPDEAQKAIFLDRFGKQPNDEFVARQQCRQLMLGDYENYVPVKRENTKERTLKKWRGLLNGNQD